MAREIEARLKLSAVDRTSAAFNSLGKKMSEVDRKARAVSAASSRMSAVQAAMVARATGVLGGVAVGAAAKKAFTDFAAVDRRLTRIGITADASAEALADVRGRLFAIAQESAVPIDQVTSGLEDLTAQGRSLGDAMAFLPAVTRTAAAAGAEVKDIAATAGAVSDSLGVAANRMQAAFDVMVAGGKAGKFELKDMSQCLPAIAPAAAAVGLKGEEGLRRLVAMLQIVRNQTGDASSAATNLSNVFQKMETDETAKKFSKFGIDLRREMGRARKEGRDMFTTFLDLSARALNGDMSKLPQLFTDAQFAAGMRALLSQRDGLDKLIAALRNVDGSTIGDVSRLTQDAQASIDRLANSWNRFVANAGRTIANSGVPGFLDKVSDVADRLNALKEAEDRKPGGARDEYVRQAVKDGIPRDVAEDMWGAMTGTRTPAQEKAVAEADRTGARQRYDAAVATLGDLDRIRARYGSEPLPAVLQARYDAAKATIAREPRDYGQRFPPVVDRARLAAGEAQRFRPGPETFPLPKSRPEDGAAAIGPAMQGLVAEIDRQGATAVERARAIWGQIEAIFRQPITPNIRPPRQPLDPGRSFQNGDFTGAP